MGRVVRVYHHKKRIRRILLMLIDKHDIRCYFCNSRITLKDFPTHQTDNVSIHHIDHNSQHNDIGNLALAHRSCHKRYHMLCQKRRNKWLGKWLYANRRYVMGKVGCVILVRYRKKAKMRNCMIKLLADYKHWKKGDTVVMPVRKLWRVRRNDKTLNGVIKPLNRKAY